MIGLVAIIALALGATIGYGLSSGMTSTLTRTYTVTIGGYYVTFIQQPAVCPPSLAVYVAPWSVTLGNQTKVQPPNAPTTSQESAGPSNKIYSKIVFLVPNGIYNYTLNKNRSSYYPFVSASGAVLMAGTVSVDGSNVTVQVNPEVYCHAVTSTTSSG